MSDFKELPGDTPIEEVEAEIVKDDDDEVPAWKRKGRRGRPKGSQTNKTQELVKRVSAEGVTPVEVMLANMRWWFKEARMTQARVKTLLAEVAMNPDAENVKELCETIALLDRWREKSQDAAVDAAPYMHPKLGALVVKGDANNPLLIQVKAEERRHALADRLARLTEASGEDEVPQLTQH